MLLTVCYITVTEVCDWSGIECPSYPNVGEMVPSNEMMTAVQLVNQLEEVGNFDTN